MPISGSENTENNYISLTIFDLPAHTLLTDAASIDDMGQATTARPTNQKIPMIHKTRFFYPTLAAALLCGTVAAVLHAQDGGANGPRPPQGPPPSPLFDALDTNHDGIISADEIANASTALKALLKNGAVQITRQDVEPPHPTAARDPRDRDGRDQPRPHFRPPAMHPHRPPPVDDQAMDEPAPPRRDADEDRADRPRHRPPPPEFGDEQAMDEPARRHPHPADRADRPPRPNDEEEPMADDNARPRPRMDDQAERPHHRPPPPSPLFDALDTNHDGVISADEIAHAPEALKKLDKSGSGQIKREDLKASRPPPESD